MLSMRGVGLTTPAVSRPVRPSPVAPRGVAGFARHAPLVCRAATGVPEGVQAPKEEKPAPVPVLAGGDGGNGNGASGGGGGGGGGGGDGSSGDGGKPMDPKIVAMLAAAGRSVDSFPADFKLGLLGNKVTPEILERFFSMESNFFAKMVWGIDGFRERLLGDPSFPVKLAIEIGIGVVMKITAEYTKRGESFYREADFVFANTLMAIIADFMLTWLPAPTLSYKWVRVGVTNTLLCFRQLMDPTLVSPNQPQNVVATSAAYGVYMSVSSNLRYQIVAGIVEERGIEVLFKGRPELCHLLSFIARTGNTFLGSMLWVDFVRLCGMQKAGPAKAEAH
ncbi:hypothetical protein TSOC_012090 [Tetrabaena socialis]|uniref:Uncharacterized protein n=1 Tax=Tetrabaena socialis TaxID=47790 RepID=A0A2J7ZNX1_9CHLO|nr:hypothetical protein TSOC_012090 [Tetrabaena socialis]|eukprot:PNH01974.1 hypothetical protein TSOC_012090 [Tetrabaena socialis]